MIHSIRLIMLVFLLAVAYLSSTGVGIANLQTVGGYHQEPLWRLTTPFPRWNDTYVIVFEQEMLA